ncbi:uncharacterized protein LOC120681340 [Panicum virgatum]|uniref:uncharacterized protein LOC120681340 n=1 Tax=Panicum virgatum TaxID=38727 RepID=UPI0019D69216|nr:uncharacterized protein LOC120681340 [Panicum virgatum]
MQLNRAGAKKHGKTTPVPTPSSADAAQVEQHQRQDGTRGEDEIIAEGLILLPPQLQKLTIEFCRELSLHSNPVDQNREAGRTWEGQGLKGLRSLPSLHILSCPRLLSYSSSSSYFPFPDSLEHLHLWGAAATLLPLSNLTSLTDLAIVRCGDLRVEGLRPRLAQGRLTQLTVRETPNFFAGFEPSLPHEQEFPSSSSKLKDLETDDVAGLLAAPICVLLSSSLTELHFWGDEEVARFTKEQEEALRLLTSLERILFCGCDKLQCLPAGLHRLPNLKEITSPIVQPSGRYPRMASQVHCKSWRSTPVQPSGRCPRSASQVHCKN